MRTSTIKVATAAVTIASAIGLFYGQIALAQATTSIKVVPPGIYGNVRMSRATGDLGGIEIEVHPGAARILDVTVCEGWCNWAYQVAYEDRGGSIAFQILERPDDPPRKFRATRRGKSVLIEEDGEFVVHKYRLARLKERFGLDVADTSMREYVKETNAQAR